MCRKNIEKPIRVTVQGSTLMKLKVAFAQNINGALIMETTTKVVHFRVLVCRFETRWWRLFSKKEKSTLPFLVQYCWVPSNRRRSANKPSVRFYTNVVLNDVIPRQKRYVSRRTGCKWFICSSCGLQAEKEKNNYCAKIWGSCIPENN